MPRRMWFLAGVAVALAGSSGCGLFCERYCERERDRCDRLYQNRGCCAPAAPACCAPAPGPVPGNTYYAQPPCP